MIDKQKIFDQCVRGLASQDYQRSTSGGTCQLRGRWGRKCALGWLIPDDMYAPKMEFHPVLYATEIITGAPSHDCEPMEFLMELQNAHDFGETPTSMCSTLCNIARDHGLTWPEDA